MEWRTSDGEKTLVLKLVGNELQLARISQGKVVCQYAFRNNWVEVNQLRAAIALARLRLNRNVRLVVNDHAGIIVGVSRNGAVYLGRRRLDGGQNLGLRCFFAGDAIDTLESALDALERLPPWTPNFKGPRYEVCKAEL